MNLQEQKVIAKFEIAAGSVVFSSFIRPDGRVGYLVAGDNGFARPKEWCESRRYARDHFNMMRRQLKSGVHRQTW